MIEKTLATQGGVVYYWIAGEGEHTIVFTHGATMDHGLFQNQVPFFSKNYRVITWDAPLHGKSRPYTGFSLQTAADTLTAILDQEQVSAVHLAGQSMGGYICQICAADHPERVKSITAIDSSPIQLAYYSRLDRWLLGLTPSLLKFYPYKTLINMVANQIAITQPAKDYAFAVLSQLSMAEITEIMNQVYTGLIQYDKGTLNCPILIVYGDQDKTGKVIDYSNRWAKNENRLLRVIPHAAHNANMDNPTEFNQAMNDFLLSIV